jgi:hypothetical protein
MNGQQGKTHWFDAVVMKMNEDGTANVRYPDGGVERNVPAR